MKGESGPVLAPTVLLLVCCNRALIHGCPMGPNSGMHYSGRWTITCPLPATDASYSPAPPDCCFLPKGMPLPGEFCVNARLTAKQITCCDWWDDYSCPFYPDQTDRFTAGSYEKHVAYINSMRNRATDD